MEENKTQEKTVFLTNNAEKVLKERYLKKDKTETTNKK